MRAWKDLKNRGNLKVYENLPWKNPCSLVKKLSVNCENKQTLICQQSTYTFSSNRIYKAPTLQSTVYIVNLNNYIQVPTVCFILCTDKNCPSWNVYVLSTKKKWPHVESTLVVITQQMSSHCNSFGMPNSNNFQQLLFPFKCWNVNTTSIR